MKLLKTLDAIMAATLMPTGAHAANRDGQDAEYFGSH